MRITREWLERHEACHTELELFIRVFPDGVDLTRENLVKHGETFDVIWLVEQFLSHEELDQFWNDDRIIWSQYCDNPNMPHSTYLAKRTQLVADALKLPNYHHVRL